LPPSTPTMEFSSPTARQFDRQRNSHCRADGAEKCSSKSKQGAAAVPEPPPCTLFRGRDTLGFDVTASKPVVRDHCFALPRHHAGTRSQKSCAVIYARRAESRDSAVFFLTRLRVHPLVSPVNLRPQQPANLQGRESRPPKQRTGDAPPPWAQALAAGEESSGSLIWNFFGNHHFNSSGKKGGVLTNGRPSGFQFGGFAPVFK